MKRVLIAGAESYLGVSLEKALREEAGAFEVHTLDLREQGWQQASFAGFDAVLQVAGIAHQKETEANREAYYAVNRDLAVAVAKKAKTQMVKT